MKAKIYLRIGLKRKGGFAAAATTSRPNYDALRGTPVYGVTPILPTLAFAVEFEIPETLLRQAEQVAVKINLEGKQVSIGGAIAVPKTK